MRTLRIFITSLIVGWFGGCFSTLPYPDAGAIEEVPPEVALEALAQEVAAARALGFEELSRGEERDWRRGFFSRELPFEKGCVAFVAALSGPRADTSARFVSTGDVPDLARSTPSLNVTHLQACAPGRQDTRVLLDASTGARSLAPPNTLHWVLLVASSEKVTNAQLTRGFVPRDPENPVDELLEQLAK